MKLSQGRMILASLAIELALLLMSACSSPTIGSGSGTPTSSLTVLQVLQNSANAMKQLKTVHFDTTNSGTVAGSNGTSSATPAAGTPATSNGSFNLTGSGDVVIPDQQSVKVTLNQNTNL